MTGAHRRPAQRPAVLIARAVVLITRAVVWLALLALTAAGIYLSIADHAAALYFVIGLQVAVWILVIGEIAWSLRPRPRSPAQRAGLLGRVLLPVGGTTMLLSVIGQQHGWLHGGAESALIWTTFMIAIGVSVYQIPDVRRLMAALTARAAAKQGQCEQHALCLREHERKAWR
jgi:hypothetical protein